VNWNVRRSCWRSYTAWTTCHAVTDYSERYQLVPCPARFAAWNKLAQRVVFLLNTVNVGRLNQQRTFTDYSECCWRHSGYFAVTHMALPGISACWQITLYWLQWTFVSSCLSGCTDYSERSVQRHNFYWLQWMLSRSGQIDLLITVNGLSQCDNVYWLQWIFADDEYKAFTDYSERLALCENVFRICWLQWTSHQHDTYRCSLTCFLFPRIIYWLQWIFSHRSLITVDLLLIAVNVGHRRIFASWLQWTFQQFQPPQPFSFLYLKHTG